ncbi:PfkB family carbohydrate kinase [Streptomyces hygroscopicus]|uniref:PfkB family carbohydrate kinase n=1 Tax=Streptomyces hygroscopicus TaxID=1912 RepID=UPI00223FE78F|nr:PfkB family carbohydrate kinase [Streptomyces hygroscopicus]
MQIASASARRALSTRLRNLRPEGTLVSFDTDYRPSGWHSPQEAADVMDRFAGLADIVLASWDDETALHDSLTPEAAAQRLAALGPCEVIVKTGADGAHLLVGTQLHHTPAVVPARVLDTTAAGDAFAGGYLAARITGRAPPRPSGPQAGSPQWWSPTPGRSHPRVFRCCQPSDELRGRSTADPGLARRH